jgi:hypothetical protein
MYVLQKPMTSSDLLSAVRALHVTLDRRERPEDVAEKILNLHQQHASAFGVPLSTDDRRLLERKVSGAGSYWWMTSMSDDFDRPVGAQSQMAVAGELFAADGTKTDADDFESVRDFIETAADEIGKTVGASDFKFDRLNREQRERMGLGGLSRRQYNKRFRLLARMEQKALRLERETLKRHFAQVSKSALANRVTFEQFAADLDTACFIAYFVARCNLRSEFTNTSQERPFDVVCERLLARCRPAAANWQAIAYVYPSQDVLARLSDDIKGQLLADWLGELRTLAGLMRGVWEANDFDAETMVVSRGDDSSTWNALAGAWNRARTHWIALLYALGFEELLDSMCLGKALRLMAADVVWWHRESGGDLEADTFVFRELPFPWEVLDGEQTCTRADVEAVCARVNVDARAKGWVAQRPQGAPAPVRPTPELVHGVTVHSPQLAGVLRRAGWFSGYPRRLRALPDDTVVTRADIGRLANDPADLAEARAVREHMQELAPDRPDDAA